MGKRINIFGDSIAWGAYDREGGWIDRLKRYLLKSPNDYDEVYNLGISGDSTEELLRRFRIENEARESDLIIFAIGTNDASYFKPRNENWVPMDKFEKNLLELIAQAKKFTNEIVFVGLLRANDAITAPAPWATDFYYYNKNIEIYNNKLKEICEKNKLLFIEMQDLLSNEDLEDGLHPNSIGHEKIFLRVKDALEANKII